MRRALPALLAALPLAACVTAPAPGMRVQTTSEANRESIEGAAQAPLRDLNLLRTKIPEVLLRAMADPYARPASMKCPQIVAAIVPLNAALGADLDVPSADEDDLLEKGREGAYGAMASVATGVIPFRGWVRQLTGAERHDRFVQAAITAGAVRRGYLKGLGESRGCNPPATPSHEFAGREPVSQELKPRFPTRLPAPAPGTPAGKSPASPRR